MRRIILASIMVAGHLSADGPYPPFSGVDASADDAGVAGTILGRSESGFGGSGSPLGR